MITPPVVPNVPVHRAIVRASARATCRQLAGDGQTLRVISVTIAGRSLPFNEREGSSTFAYGRGVMLSFLGRGPGYVLTAVSSTGRHRVVVRYTITR